MMWSLYVTPPDVHGGIFSLFLLLCHPVGVDRDTARPSRVVGATALVGRVAPLGRLRVGGAIAHPGLGNRAVLPARPEVAEALETGDGEARAGTGKLLVDARRQLVELADAGVPLEGDLREPAETAQLDSLRHHLQVPGCRAEGRVALQAPRGQDVRDRGDDGP